MDSDLLFSIIRPFRKVQVHVISSKKVNKHESQKVPRPGFEIFVSI